MLFLQQRFGLLPDHLKHWANSINVGQVRAIRIKESQLAYREVLFEVKNC